MAYFSRILVFLVLAVAYGLADDVREKRGLGGWPGAAGGLYGSNPWANIGQLGLRSGLGSFGGGYHPSIYPGSQFAHGLSAGSPYSGGFGGWPSSLRSFGGYPGYSGLSAHRLGGGLGGHNYW